MLILPLWSQSFSKSFAGVGRPTFILWSQNALVLMVKQYNRTVQPVPSLDRYEGKLHIFKFHFKYHSIYMRTFHQPNNRRFQIWIISTPLHLILQHASLMRLKFAILCIIYVFLTGLYIFYQERNINVSFNLYIN